MAIKIAANLKKSMLKSIGVVKVAHGRDVDHYSVISVTPTYGVTGNQAYFEVSNVTLPVNANTTVENICLFTNSGLLTVDIELEGSEIHEYTVNGTYTINNLRISF